MRPLRFLLTILVSVTAFILLVFVQPWRTRQDDIALVSPAHAGPRLGSYIHWRTPSSLFSPSATISLTDDNTTFFLARPAGFGPVLPAKSLSGELWIGGGFGAAGQEGEQGCSDVPGWDGASSGQTVGADVGGVIRGSDLEGSGVEEKARTTKSRAKRGQESADATNWYDEDDGTDDHLHRPLSFSGSARPRGGAVSGASKRPIHADIQSLQETAEIAGKIVLLSRGGCGFLEKVKWVQRRGGVALIVGDNIRGAQLVTMYARGDTSNVTIPSLFTSHTTAHLLSSLIPSGRLAEAITGEDATRPGLIYGDGLEPSRQTPPKSVAVVERPDFTTSDVAAKATKTPSSLEKQRYNHQMASLSDAHDGESADDEQVGWLRGMFGGKHVGSGDRSHVGWIQEEFEDSWDHSYLTTTSTRQAAAPTQMPKQNADDGFVIGVQDWRDPDLVAEQKEQLLASTPSSSLAATQASKTPAPDRFDGGSITPGSGEYVEKLRGTADSAHSNGWSEESYGRFGDADTRPPQQGRWFGRLLHSHGNEEDDSTDHWSGADGSQRAADNHFAQNSRTESSKVDGQTVCLHDGLWVTLAPTSMSSSPFFDTLLVLVVSPLVTLTVVYALLLLRSRIRRRRWRAPKSVVERLPVRTYQTMPTSTNSSTSSTASVASTPITASTPLLPPSQQQSSRPISTRSNRQRPRSRTVASLPLAAPPSLTENLVASASTASTASPPSSSLEQLEEKRAAGLAEWRRRYGGRQRECVVCLEEYIDGVSRVMSLPCGHEFHAECITPWLTTRRRTCPICKGDVVRSLARSGGSTGSSSSSSANSNSLSSTFLARNARSSHTRTQSSRFSSSREEDSTEATRNVSGNGEQEFAELLLVAPDDEDEEGEGDADADERDLFAGSLALPRNSAVPGAGFEERSGPEAASAAGFAGEGTRSGFAGDLQRDLETGVWDRTR